MLPQRGHWLFFSTTYLWTYIFSSWLLVRNSHMFFCLSFVLSMDGFLCEWSNPFFRLFHIWVAKNLKHNWTLDWIMLLHSLFMLQSYSILISVSFNYERLNPPCSFTTPEKCAEEVLMDFSQIPIRAPKGLGINCTSQSGPSHLGSCP